ncbi:bacteriophage abortive infection AbiH family protein [Paraglaciecola arctica]|uniref:Bacteriophage abortive infection AbiH n=1 Tax=Paraglaciecola arctica BSs20135 TaxID=493475 RepID=K6Z7R8_9ALTE|nr:bacteriophage abortive infection AbiH family protein [Paraglaciecola arctica]GAC19485.1 conserved hypothetical protein [Paraglaciecola arctica BSs20135]
MNVLYIIGNGFDRWHGLPTSYCDFYKYSKQTLDQYKYFFEQSGVTEPWSDFENNLGEYDWELLYCEYEQPNLSSESFRSSYVYGLEDGITEQTESLVSDITSEFESWVNSIDITNVSPKMCFIPESKFLSFNYTNTLQSVYKVPHGHVKHIHGNVDTREKLIFGHCSMRMEPSEFDEDGYSNSKYFHDAENAARKPLAALKKPVEFIIDNLSHWFDSLTDIDCIVVLGHSLNSVDMPYFKRIFEFNPSAEWVVSCYSTSECEKHRGSLVNIGITIDKIRTCDLDKISEVLDQ